MSEKTVLVYSSSGQRLVNTIPCKAKRMLKGKKAKVIGLNPFAIQLLYETKIYGAFNEFLNKNN